MGVTEARAIAIIKSFDGSMRHLDLACLTQRRHFDSAQCSQAGLIVNGNDYSNDSHVL
jgi:hypothetical protein